MLAHLVLNLYIVVRRERWRERRDKEKSKRGRGREGRVNNKIPFDFLAGGGGIKSLSSLSLFVSLDAFEEEANGALAFHKKQK
jgi:hypothetical protein